MNCLDALAAIVCLCKAPFMIGSPANDSQRTARCKRPNRFLHGDAEAVAASGMPLPSLRVLQAAGTHSGAENPQRSMAASKRMWREGCADRLDSAAISEHFSWNIRIVAEAMAKTRPGTWSALDGLDCGDHLT